MAVDGDLQRHHGAGDGFGDGRARAPVDHIGRQMQQQIDQPRRLAAIQQIAKQLVLLRSHAGEAGDGREQGIEQGRAHSQDQRRNFGPNCSLRHYERSEAIQIPL